MLEPPSVVLTGNLTSSVTVGIFLPWGCAKVLRSFQRLSQGEASPVTSHVFTLVNAETRLLSQLMGPVQVQPGAAGFLMRLGALV